MPGFWVYQRPRGFNWIVPHNLLSTQAYWLPTLQFSSLISLDSFRALSFLSSLCVPISVHCRLASFFSFARMFFPFLGLHPWHPSLPFIFHSVFFSLSCSHPRSPLFPLWSLTVDSTHQVPYIRYNQDGTVWFMQVLSSPLGLRAGLCTHYLCSSPWCPAQVKPASHSSQCFDWQTPHRAWFFQLCSTTFGQVMLFESRLL